MGGYDMTYPELKEKYGERIMGIACTDIVLTGIKENLREDGAYNNQLRSKVLKCITDINNSEWNDLRNIIKRSL